MIQIDKLSFDFVVPQEESAKRLYSNWDSFCHQCFVQVAEEYFNAYDNDDVIYEFERIDLDLGVITEENIYEEYPKRLREQLMKINPSSIRKCADKNEELNPNSHIVNFIYFLRYGCLRTDSIIDFNNEIEWLNNLSDTEIDTCVKEIVGIVRINDSFFYRLTSYITNTTFLHRLFQTVISMPEYGIKERRRFFILFLELRKDIIVGFIHKTSDFAILNNLSELLDCNSVKMIMSEETALFATAGIASFWHSFYVWMIQSYPYDETEMYGDKSQFIRHIHRQLLMFVSSGNRFSYFSKDELVSQFLKSVFGADKYIYMIDVIYRRLSDTSGKISAQNYQLQELYMVFVRLSMMNSLSFSSKNIPTNVQSKHTFTSYQSMINRLTDFLRNENINDSDKQILVKQIVDDYPELFVKWLHENSRDLQNIMQYFTGIFNEYHIYRLLASISVSLIEWTKDLKNSIKNTQRYFTWLNNVSDERLEQLFCKSILLWIADDSCYSEHRFKRLINLIYHQITGNNVLSIKEFQSLQEKLSMILSESEIINDSTVINHNDSTEINHDRLKMILLSSEVSDTVKRRESALFWSNHSRDYSEAITILHHYGILSLVVRHTNSNALREIIHGLSVHSFGTSSVSLLQRIYDWLESHDVYVNSHVIIAEAEIIPQLLLWISESKSKDVALTREILLSLFALFFGKSDAESSLRYFVEEIAKDNEQSLLSELHVYEHIEHNKETVKGRLSRLSDDDIARLKSVFLSSEASNAVKSRESALFWSNHSEDYSEAITILHQSGLLSLVVRHTNSNALREIIHGLSVHSFGTSSVSLLQRIYDWLESHDDYVNSHVIIAEAEIIPQFLLWISESKSKDVALTKEVLLSLFALFFGKSDAESSLRYFVEEIAKDNEQSLLSELHVYEHIEHNKETVKGRLSRLSDDDIARLESVFLSSEASNAVKRRETALFWSNHSEDYSEAITILHQSGLLSLVVRHTNSNALREIIHGLSVHSFGTSSVSLLHRIYDWLESHDDYVNSHVIIAETDRIPQFLLWISESKSKDVTLTREILLSLFAMLFGKSDAESSLRYFVKEIAKGNEQSLLFELKSYEETGVTDSDKANITSLDNLVESGVSEIFKIRLLHYYLHNSPRQLLEYIRSTVKQGILLERQWCEWIDTNELRDLACGISISVTDLFIQIVDILQIDKETERKVWVAYFVRYNNDDWFYNTSEENIEQFVDEFYIIQGKNEDEILTEKKQLIQNIKETLNIVLLDNPTEDLTNEQIVNNAGLCLLAPWFVRLFDMLGYLDSEHKKLKNTSSKIRAVFLLQYLVYGEERKYEEYELIFNRLLTDLPQYIPIPKCLNLTDEERQIADGMISGVKANWENMKGTSDSGFRKSFISRNGVLEQKDEYWMLTINEKAYDILLETIPWAFRQIRLPWLKKMIQVSWHDKQII